MRYEMMEKASQEIGKLVSKKHVFFADRGNTAILLALKLAVSLGKSRLFMQDQGGWITYGQYGRKLKLEMISFATDHGIIRLEDLSGLDEKSILLVNSMPGYYALQKNMGEITSICESRGAFLINDASGSIGTESAKHGDIILGSFGEWKPVEVGYGGFLAFDKEYRDFFRAENKRPVNDFQEKLLAELAKLEDKTRHIFALQEKVKKDLLRYDILQRDSKGFNVIVMYSTDKEKEELLAYCVSNKLEYTECPRYIRVLDKAISIELKR
ncbi:MAG: hypothetical protein HGA85_08380 [Nanoarchaeota archaeon]|nr:hypothetical protein [Nanoarchaeota archaeon]